MYSAEVFPLAQREQGLEWAVAVTNLLSPVLALILPRLLRNFTTPGAFGFSASLNAIAFVMLFLVFRESKPDLGTSLHHADDKTQQLGGLKSRLQYSPAIR